MDSDIQYFNAVIDTANLISIWLKNNKEDLKKILSTLEINLESKYGPFTSKLSNQIGMNETLGLKVPDSYWKGVQDTLSLIKNFLNWKESSQSPRPIENFLLEIVNKSNFRIQPDESPLISTLGLSFDHEFTDSSIQENKIDSVKNEFSNVNFQEEMENLRPENKISQPKVEEKIEAEISEPIPEEDKAFDPKEFIDDETFLDQFIADSISPETNGEKGENLITNERNYIRSALEELTSSQGEVEEEEEEKEIEIKFKNSADSNSNQSTNEVKPIIESVEDNLDDKNSNRLLSSSLRDALRMLREEE